MTEQEYQKKRATEYQTCKKCEQDKVMSAFSTWRNNGRVYVKKVCSGCKSKAYRKKNPQTCKDIQKRARTKYRQDRWVRKQALLDHVGQTACLICGIEDMRVLVFHHRDPLVKSFGLSWANTHSYSLEKMKKEAEKCDVLCHNCHTIIHITNCD